MTVYADEVFFVNVVSCAMLLYSYAIMKNIKPWHIRIAAACVVCGCYAVFEAISGIGSFWRFPMLITVSASAFGVNGALRNSASLMLICIALEGIITFLTSVFGGAAVFSGGIITLFADSWVIIVIYILAYPFMLIINRVIKMRGKFRRIVMEYGGRRVEFTALYDSGNLLTYHGMPVIIIDQRTAGELLEFKSYDEWFENADAFVTYASLDKSGVMPVFIPSRCSSDGRVLRAAAAVTEREFKSRYSGIICD